MTAATSVDTEFLLLIADISGYTRFMMKNHTARVHAHGIISDLLSAVIKQVQLPLEVNKLEGDAMFMVAERQNDGWEAIGSDIGRQLDEFIARTFSLRDMVRKLGYDIRYLPARQKHPAQ
jgi:hypothetical protein